MINTIKIRDCMTTQLVTLAPDIAILRAVHTLLKQDIAGAPVVDGNRKIVGILTERDCMRIVLQAAYHSEPGGLVSDYMSTEVATLDANDSVVDAAKRFFGEHFHRYPVLDDDQLVGQISRRDVLRTLIERR